MHALSSCTLSYNSLKAFIKEIKITSALHDLNLIFHNSWSLAQIK